MRRPSRVTFRDPRSSRGNFARSRFATDPRSYRSGLEELAAAQLTKAGVSFRFEEVKVPFVEPAKSRTYTPDFVLPNGIIIETKGLFQTDDRQKHILVRKQHPCLDIRFVFSNATARIAKLSKTTYAMWADKYGFKWAHKTIPVEWLKEPVNSTSLAAIGDLSK